MNTDNKYVRQDETKGKRFAQVAALMGVLHESYPDPVPFEEACAQAGVKYPQDIQAAVHALELAEVIDRYTFVAPGSSRAQAAYALRGADAVNPTEAGAVDSTTSARTSLPMGERLKGTLQS